MSSGSLKKEEEIWPEGAISTVKPANVYLGVSHSGDANVSIQANAPLLLLLYWSEWLRIISWLMFAADILPKGLALTLWL